ncbi:MAG: ComF family protein [Deltaproteobacteria bacterium]|jgi:ComF family protein|nr:ComF family protein [Deltaproteobacteria bacterium]
MEMGGFPRLKQSAVQLFKLIFPPACPLCLGTLPSKGAGDFCPTCLAGFKPLPKAHCSCCSLPFAGAGNSSHLCSRCLKKPPPYTQVYAFGLYEDSLREAVHQFKFNRKVGLDRSLGRLLEQSIGSDLNIDLVVPVPLQRKRLQQRSYNQALLLAREVARTRSYTMDAGLLVKTKETALQHDLPAREREKNLHGAFRLERQLSGEDVLLIDDVMTTGATVAACSQVLLAGGAGSVNVAVMARAAR